MNLKKRTVLHQNGDERVSPSYLSLNDLHPIHHLLWETPLSSLQPDTPRQAYPNLVKLANHGITMLLLNHKK